MAMYLTGPDRDTLREIAQVSRDLAAGVGGPARYRQPSFDDCSLADYRRADMNVICLRRPHLPQMAMVVTALVMFGFDWETDYARLGIHGDLGEAFKLLQAEFGNAIAHPGGGGNLARGLATALKGETSDKHLIDITLGRATLVAPARPRLASLPRTRRLPALPGK